MRQCRQCKNEYPATTEYFYEQKNTKAGFRSDCKACVRKSQLTYLGNMTPQARYEMKKAEQQRNRHIYRQARRKHNAIKRGVVHEDWTEKQLMETYGSSCYICNEAIDLTLPRTGKGSEYSLWPDHVIPVSRGGENTINNVRPCHRKCNQTKYTMTYDEYIKSLEESDNE